MYSAALVLVFACAALAQGPANVLVIANQNSALSRSVSDYYVLRRRIPLAQVCRIRVTADETIPREVYERQIMTPVSACLRAGGLQDRILYLVTTAGVPLRIEGGGEGLATDAAAVDSELTLLYTDMHGQSHALKGPLRESLLRTHSGSASAILTSLCIW